MNLRLSLSTPVIAYLTKFRSKNDDFDAIEVSNNDGGSPSLTIECCDFICPLLCYRTTEDSSSVAPSSLPVRRHDTYGAQIGAMRMNWAYPVTFMPYRSAAATSIRRPSESYEYEIRGSSGSGTNLGARQAQSYSWTATR